MKKLYQVLLFLLAITFVSCQNGNEATNTVNDDEASVSRQKPNIVILFADDLGYGDLGVFGNPTIKTPNLDQMAYDGMKLTQFYSTAPICSPSRGALMTGRYPIRTGIHTGVYFPKDSLGIPAEEITMAEALKEQGYATACYGKWHLGHREPYLPTNNGFDEYLGIPYSNDMWSQRGKTFPPLPLIEGTETIEEEPDQANLTPRYTQRAVDFINQNQENPFFLYVPYTFPHVPLFASDKFRGKSLRGLYGDVIEEIDWSVGEILNALKENGMAENTLVFFTSDNGPWLVKKEESGTAGLLREGKGTCWEGGMREPSIAWWPGTIEPGQVNYNIGCTMDLYATALDIGGAALPDDRVVDGISLLPVLKGEKESVRDHFFYYKGSELYAVRKGKWKAHYRTVENMYTKEVDFQEHDPPLLYNLDVDPQEMFNLAEENPEVLAELEKLVNEHKSNLVVKPSVIR